MSLWDNIKKFAQPYSDEDYDDYEDEVDEYEEPAQETAPRGRRPSPSLPPALLNTAHLLRPQLPRQHPPASAVRL